LEELLDLSCSHHAWERWLERSDLAHPGHDRWAVVSYVLGRTHRVRPDVAVDVLEMVDKTLWRTRSVALMHWHYWDGSDLLFVVVPPNTGLEMRSYPTVRTMVRLTMEQERWLKSVLDEIKSNP
jgi:hypothetical protein